MNRLFLISMLFFFTFSLNAQQTQPVHAGLGNNEHLSFVGMMIPELIQRFGPPVTIAVERGIAVWQDDVVFQYNGADFYIYRDRVWQVRLNSTHGISNGDRKAVVMLTLGNRASDMGDHVQMPISGRDWPLMLRVNFNNSEQVSAIYIYRPDY